MTRNESHILSRLNSLSSKVKLPGAVPMPPPPDVTNVGIIKQKVSSFATTRYGHPEGPVYRPVDFNLSPPPYTLNPNIGAGTRKAWDTYLSKYNGWHESLLKQWVPQHTSDDKARKVLKFNISTTCTTEDVGWDSDPQHLWSAVNTTTDGIACVVCSPTLSWDVLQILGCRYGIPPKFFMPSVAQPPPIELQGDTVSIRLGFPRDPTNLWLLDDLSPCTDENYKSGRIEMDSYKIWIKDVDGVPCVVCFASSDDVPMSILNTLGNPYWKTRLRDWQSRDLRRLLPLPFIWYTVRRWDEICEAVSTFAGLQETQLNPGLARRLHFLRAHILFSEGLLINLKVILNELQEGCKDDIVLKECKTLLAECNRLEFRRRLQGDRVQNVIDMIYSHSTTRASEAAVRDSRDMMQVSRLTMLFLPASVMAGIFGINSTVIDQQTSLVLYLVLTVPLTLMTIWAFVAMQIENYFRDFPRGAWFRFFWPYYIFRRRCNLVDPV